MSRRIFTSAFSYWRSPSRHNDNRSISFLKNIFGGKEKECKSYENVEETKREPPNPNKLNPKCCVPSQPPTLPDTCGTYKSFEWFDPTQTEGSMKIKQVLMGNASPVVAPPSICKGKSICKPPNPPAAPPVENNKGSIFALPSCPMPCVVPPCCPPSPGCPQPPSFAPKCPCPPPPKCPPPCCPPPPKCPPPCCPPPPKCPPPCCPPPPKCPPPCPPPCCPPPKCPPPCPPPKCPPPCPPPPKCPPPCPPKCPPPCPPPCPCPPPPKCPPPPCCPPPPKCPPPCCPPPPKCPPPCCPPPPKCPPPPCCPPPPKCPPPPCCPPPPKCPPPCPPPCCPPPPKCPPPPCCPPPPKCPPPPCCPPPPKCPPPCPPKCPKCSGVSAEAIELRECSSCGPSLNLFSLNSARESLLQAFVLKGNREYSKNVNETNGNISLLSKPMENSPRSINIEEIINSKEVKLERRKSVDFKSLGNREMGSTVTVKEVKMRLDGEQGKKLTRRFSLPEFLTTSKKYSTTPAKTCNNSLTSSNNVEAGAADLFPLFSEYPKQELNLKNPGFHLSYNLDSFLPLPSIWAKTPVNKSKIST